ncbi:1-(5-phosphoribosyl)-5-[(5-phosphoribosylamino)methylideneamino]imidazole-4-carboxamide isomerase [Blochmannia endosymbiont of Colobopsis nipponica]|uniref:1-(5-phosphoribosyl)-5-[(5- phosphoribosylamino)methylideneamino]imidazole-4- carboxamide isomerase n=1 Tax=Blochmannia endosymbiont of Colobopsis nipponica TaxID=2681987 RepID=UPI00177B8C11|nr:1-(5-phosphoribosyl)-5-[(5-phosphoribosylamino)methylideneamino]imidazole-4-carboxamide isomerase [Blochmannia endosymbiont of Colobopsis nipponica]QOI11354.1 1-(5-phosphoribosyl)-5-[(5-phosphoribosylamino)methylideneamino]imidazole-4-carboxamide isomerase [Blochmannia endosymbiont of Colobopsis nipponica]
MIIPALDLIENKIVRLNQGCYTKQYHYDQEPIFYLQNYFNQGAKFIHLIDLNGARNPTKRQIFLLKNILTHNKQIKFQVGGGIRSLEDIKNLLDMGANKIILSSIAITKPQIVKQWLKYFGAKTLILALDIRINNRGERLIAINGWQKTSKFKLEEIIEQYNTMGIKHILCTDISRDGTLSGSNINLYTDLCKTWSRISFQASGGIHNLEDIKNLKKSGVQNIIIGRAFLEKKITVMEAIKCWQNA